MKTLSTVVLVIGVISLISGVVLRLAVREIAMGLVPSSFLDFGIACFLLTIAINTLGKE